MAKTTLTKEEQQAYRKTMMLTEPLNKIIPKMALPTIVAFLINSIYSLADTYFVSSLGTNATAAVSVNSSLDQIIMMAGSLLAVGANSYVSRLMGARQEEKANTVLSSAFFLAVGFGVALLIVGQIFMVPMVRLLGATPTCEQYSIDYATFVLLAAPFMTGSYVLNQCLRAEGSATLSMVGLSFGGVLNCVLDPIFIFGLDMGVAGASLATAISKTVSFGILIFPYLTKRSLLRLHIRYFRPTWDIMAQVVSVGSSSLFRTGFAVVSAILLNNIAGNISDSVLAGIGVTNKVMMFPFAIILGIGNGFLPVAGFNWGAARYDRVRESFRFAAKMNVSAAAAMGVLCIIFAKPMIHVFAGTDPEMLAIGALAIRSQALVLAIHALGVTVNMFCSALGRAKSNIVLATSRQGTCFLPILPIMALFGGPGVAVAQAVADLIHLVLIIPILRFAMKDVDKAEQALLSGEAPKAL